MNWVWFVLWRGRGDCTHHLSFSGDGSSLRQVQKWHLAQKETSVNFKSPDLGSSAYKLIIINYNYRLWHKLCLIFSLQPWLMFIGVRVIRSSRKEISSMLFIFTLKELNWTAMRKNWRPNCTTTGLLHILNLVRWWELKYPFFFSFEAIGLSVLVFWKRW